MPKIFQTFVKRKGKASDNSNSEASNVALVGIGRSLSNRFELLAGKLGLGRTIGVDSIGYRTPVEMGRGLASIVSGENIAAVGMGRQLENNIKTAPVPVSQGRGLLLITISNEFGAMPTNAAGYDVGGNNDWANAANLNGAVNGTTNDEAAITGGKGAGQLTEKGGGIRGSFENPLASKDIFTIESVTLRIYLRQTGTALANGTLAWRLTGPLAQELGAETGNVDQEYTIDLTSQVGGDWEKLRGNAIEIEGSSALLGRSCFARYAIIDVVSAYSYTP